MNIIKSYDQVKRLKEQAVRQNSCLKSNAKFIIFIAILMISLPCATCAQAFEGTQLLDKAYLSQFSNFIDKHKQEHYLQINPIFKREIINPVKQIFFIYNSIQFIELCFVDYQGSKMPQYLRKRSYKSIFNTYNNSVRCFTIFNKVNLIQEPSHFLKENKQQSSFSASFNKKNREYAYLKNQIELQVWLFRLCSRINEQLIIISKQVGKKLTLESLESFSLKILEGQDQKLFIHEIWVQKEALPRFDITKRLSGRGFHQQVTYTIDTSKMKGKPQTNIQNSKYNIDINQQECTVRITETLPHSTYVDIDQIRSHNIKVILQNGQSGKDGVSFVNVEKPAYESRQYQYQLLVPWKMWVSNQPYKYMIKVPVHFRYPTPYRFSQEQKTKDEKNIYDYLEIQLNPLARAEIRCESKNVGEIRKYQAKQNHLFTKGSTLIPVGDGQIKQFVNAVTLISELICAVLLIKLIKK